MMSNDVGSGGFFLPKVYEKNQKLVANSFVRGDFDQAAMTAWSFADEFLCFAMKSEFLKFADKSFPNPRFQNEVPIWFLLTCQFLLRIHQSQRYSNLKTLLRSGSVLSRVGFNVGSGELGFNNKNTKPRTTAVDQDTVRKFFKDADPNKIRSWHNIENQKWFRSKKAFHADGIFILDQTRVVVPNNKNYEDARMMPVDENGHLYNMHGLSEQQKKALPRRRCYTLSVLLHTDRRRETLHIAGYEFGPGTEDELDHANKMIPVFCKNHPGVMKLLIMDKGYVSGDFVSMLKSELNVDFLMPLKSNMNNFTDAVSIGQQEGNWKEVNETIGAQGRVLSKTRAQSVDKMDLWDKCQVPINTTVFETTRWSNSKNEYRTHFWVLASTKTFNTPQICYNRYKIRTEIEERFRQFKLTWNLKAFPSPSRSLIESHICFTLLSYSLVELYLRQHQYQEKLRQMISTLRRDESLGKDAIIVYSGGSYAVFSLREYTDILVEMTPEARSKVASDIDKVEGD